MEFLKRSWSQTKAFYDQLSAERKWIMVLLGVILAGALFLGSIYSAGSDLMALPPVPADRQTQVGGVLQAAGIEVRSQAGLLSVAQTDYDRAMAALAQNSLLAPDISAAFDELIKQQSPWTSNEQNRQAWLAAKQKTLGKIIGLFTHVQSAHVLLDIPERRGFGDTAAQGSASVTVRMQGSHQISQANVDAIASLVSGAVARIRPEDVAVIDANSGTRFTIDSGIGQLPGRSFEILQAQEQHYKTKIERALGYIHGVIVAVNVRADPVINRQVKAWQFDENEPLRMTSTREEERLSFGEAGEPGVRANAGTTIEGSGGARTSEKISEEVTEFDQKNLVEESVTMQSGHTVKQVNVTINVPRSYFVSLYRLQNPDDEAAPTPQALQPLVDAELKSIVEQVKPLIAADDNTGIVQAAMTPDRTLLLAAMGGGEQEPGRLNQWISDTPVTMVLLALVSVALMLLMVRQATRQPVLPSVEELAGVPPTLPSDEDIIGEVDEGDATMEGVEVNEEELQARKIAEQISEMIKSNPKEAAGLFNRWLRSDEF